MLRSGYNSTGLLSRGKKKIYVRGRAEDTPEKLEHLPAVQEALGWVPSTTETGHGFLLFNYINYFLFQGYS